MGEQERKIKYADAALARRDPKHAVVLIFGPDLGLVRERAGTLVKRVVPDIADPFAVIRLEGDELSSDPRRLMDETRTVGLFGGERVVWIRAGTRNIVPALEPVLAEPCDTLVVVEAGDLKKGAPLRSLYLWMVNELMASRIPAQPDRLLACRELLEPLRDAWKQALTLEHIAVSRISSGVPAHATVGSGAA